MLLTVRETAERVAARRSIEARSCAYRGCLRVNRGKVAIQ